MRRWPSVLSEQDTLDRVCTGSSLARYGDGEFKICRGVSIKSQQADAKLAERLSAILHDSGECLVGVPNIRSSTPKGYFWGPVSAWSLPLLGNRPYASSFISRPDSAPWIDTDAFWSQMASLWRGQDVTLVRGSGKSFTAERLSGATNVREILCPATNAWAVYDDLLAEIGTPSRVLLCCGPTATVLAVDLCAKGVHAVDLGHAGMFVKRRQERLEALAC